MLSAEIDATKQPTSKPAHSPIQMPRDRVHRGLCSENGSQRSRQRDSHNCPLSNEMVLFGPTMQNDVGCKWHSTQRQLDKAYEKNARMDRQ